VQRSLKTDSDDKVAYQIPLSGPVLIVVASLSIRSFLFAFVVYEISLYSPQLHLLLRPDHLHATHSRRPNTQVCMFSDNDNNVNKVATVMAAKARIEIWPKYYATEAKKVTQMQR